MSCHGAGPRAIGGIQRLDDQTVETKSPWGMAASVAAVAKFPRAVHRSMGSLPSKEHRAARGRDARWQPLWEFRQEGFSRVVFRDDPDPRRYGHGKGQLLDSRNIHRDGGFVHPSSLLGAPARYAPRSGQERGARSRGSVRPRSHRRGVGRRVCASWPVGRGGGAQRWPWWGCGRPSAWGSVSFPHRYPLVPSPGLCRQPSATSVR